MKICFTLHCKIFLGLWQLENIIISGTEIAVNDGSGVLRQVEKIEDEQILEMRSNGSFFDFTKKSISFWRLYHSTVALLHIFKKNGDHVVWSSCCNKGDHLKQQRAISMFLEQHDKDIKNSFLVVLKAAWDRNITLDNSDDGWGSYIKAFQELRSSQSKLIEYTMIPGNLYRNKDHFVCELTHKEVVWKSAIDGFQKHSCN